jgi:hypothetical protein
VFFVSDVATKLGACIPGAGIPQVMEIGVEQVMRDGSLEDIFPDWLDERLAVCALFVSAPSSWRVEMFINFRLELSSSAGICCAPSDNPAAKRRQRKSLGACLATTITTNTKAAHGSSGTDAKATTVIREDVGALLADAGIPKLAGDDIEAHYWR